VPPHLSYDGAIVVDPTADDQLLTQASGEGVPVVTVGRSTQGHPWVDNDYPTIVPEVLEHLQTCGARRPALLASDPDTSYVRDTADQYTQWCAEHGYELHITYVDGGISQSAGHDAAIGLLRSDHRPDAVLTTLDQLAMGVIAAVDELGWSVPGDVLVACLGDSAMITHSRVPITAVDLSPDELGRRAVDMLIDQIEDAAAPTNQLVPGRLLVRPSTIGHDAD
jgi:DNA-binding LacI/PurR family transcriptional regulator